MKIGTSDGSPCSQSRLFGLSVRRETLPEAVDSIEKAIDGGEPTIHVALNAGKVSKMASCPDFLEMMRAFDMVHADGISVVLASRLMRDPLPERVAGIDLMDKLIERASRRGFRIFLLGAREAVVQKTADELRSRYPSLQVAGVRHGYWDANEIGQEGEVVERIRRSGADILFVGMPTPRKERFLIRHKRELGVAFAMGVGGSFDVMAGMVRRAPLSWQRAGMEWAFRLFQEPKRMWKRYLRTNTHFVWLLMKEFVGRQSRLRKAERDEDPLTRKFRG